MQINIEKFLFGFDPQKGIRHIETNKYMPLADVFIRKDDNTVVTKQYEYSPFIWTKSLNDENFFRWKTIEVPIELVQDNFVHINEELVEIDNESVFNLGNTPDGNIIIKYELKTKKERLKYYNQKKKEYGIRRPEKLKQQVDNTNIPERIKNGFKYLVKIDPNPNSRKSSSNPLFKYKRNGKVRRIRGSFTDLINFFKEGGYNIYQKTGIFLDGPQFLKQFETLTLENKVRLYFSLKKHLKELDVKLFKDNSYNSKKLYRFIKMNPAWIESIQENFLEITGEKLTKSKIRENNVMSLILEYGDLNLLLDDIINFDNIKDIFNIELNEEYVNTISHGSRDDLNLKYKKHAVFVKDYLNHFGFSNCLLEFEQKFYYLKPVEQFMIQSGKRLFKGMDNYEDLKILTLDIETRAQRGITNKRAALDPKIGEVFYIGIQTNKGLELALHADSLEEEKNIIEETYRIIAKEQPDLVLTYNGEFFDYPFLEERLKELNCVEEDWKGDLSSKPHICSIMSEAFKEIGCNINKSYLYKRYDSKLKVGGDIEDVQKTKIYGINTCDTMFAVKRAAAQNNKIPNFKLKDNIIFANVAKENRVYVEGDKIGQIGSDKRKYYLNPNTGEYFVNEFPFEHLKISFDKDKLKNGANNDVFYANKQFLYIDFEELSFLKRCTNVIQYNGSHKELFKTFLKKYQSYSSIVITNNIKNVKNLNLDRYKRHIKFCKALKVKLNDIYTLRKKVENLDDYIETTGQDIVKRYLIDDLWETKELDKIYSQATFEVSKWLPTTYENVATMGTASIWKLLLSAWSYEQRITIPDYDEPFDFTGGLVGMVSAGFHKNIVKIDYSSLYPAEFLTNVDVPDIDISGIYKVLLEFALSTRLKFKSLKNESAAKGDYYNADIYDKKQLPLKILINSFYGMLGAPFVCPFADLKSAWHITCSGRQNMRHVIRWFGKRNFKIIYFHTDGANFVIPSNVDKFKYVGKGKNKLVEKGKHYKGVEAYVAYYNDTFMKGYMGVDIDEYAHSCINLAKGNFVYLKDKKGKKVVDYVGGALKKKNQSEFITEFLDKNLKVLLEGNLKEYLIEYFNYIQKIADGKIIAKKIASKARMKRSVREYLDTVKVRQAHMELVRKHNLNIEIGDWIYFINNAENESDCPTVKEKICVISDYDSELEGLLKNFSNRERIKELIYKYEALDKAKMSYKLIKEEVDGEIVRKKVYKYDLLENIDNWDAVEIKYTTKKETSCLEIYSVVEELNVIYVKPEDLDAYVEYNATKYLKIFNKAVHQLFVAFNEESRPLIDIKTPESRPILKEEEGNLFIVKPSSSGEILKELVNLSFGVPLKGNESSQDTLEELLKTSDEEKELWNLINKSPMWAFDRNKLNAPFYKIIDKKLVYCDVYEEGCMSKQELIDFICDNPFVEYDNYSLNINENGFN